MGPRYGFTFQIYPGRSSRNLFFFTGMDDHSSALANWGDLNETRSHMDRLRPTDIVPKNLRKFINGFLEESNGLDVWRSLYPNTPGFTFRNDQGSSFSRIDYFLSSPSLTQLLEPICVLETRTQIPN